MAQTTMLLKVGQLHSKIWAYTDLVVVKVLASLFLLKSAHKNNSQMNRLHIFEYCIEIVDFLAKVQVPLVAF